MKIPLQALLLPFVSFLLLPGPARASFDSGSNGSDLAFNPPAGSYVVDLRLAGSGPGTGVFDSTRFAIVFNYTTINVSSATTVTFINHTSNAPVVWLASGNVTINGTVSLNGASGANSPTFALPGPGGFEGGRRAIDASVSPSAGGLGPGGAPFTSAGAGGGGYGQPGQNGSGGGVGGGSYGSESILPLVGGSGGAGGNITNGCSGGAGGGALLIASSGNIVLTSPGTVRANGGNSTLSAGGGGGSGGAIRLIANQVSGTGTLRATGGTAVSGLYGNGGVGRIRVEAPVVDLTDPGLPNWSFSLTPGPVFPEALTPVVRVVAVGGQPVPGTPIAGITTTDIVVADSANVAVQIEAMQVPPGTTVQVTIVPDGGFPVVYTSTPLAGTLAYSTATATAFFAPRRRVEVHLKANF